MSRLRREFEAVSAYFCKPIGTAHGLNLVRYAASFVLEMKGPNDENCVYK